MKQVNSFRYWLAFVFLLCMGMTAQAQKNLTVGTSEHGTVTFKVDGATTTTAAEGKTVIVNIAPAALGWQVDKVTATAYTSWDVAGARGEMPTEIPAVKVIAVSGQWQFTMPAYNVQVDVTYKTTSMENVTIAAVPDQTYTGFEIKPDLTVKYDGKPLTKGSDYTIKEWKNNINVGTATVTIEGVAANGFVGTKNATFQITPKSINADKISVDAIADQPYTGSQIKPAVVVKDGDRSVTLGAADYDLSYGENINVATGGTVTIKGKGNYKDERTVTFKITKVDPSVTKAPTGKTGLVYNANPQELVNGGTATGGKIEYSIDNGSTWSESIPTKTDANENGYPVQWRVTGDDNHNTTTPQTINVPIQKATLSELILDPESFTYDGKQKKPAETVKAGELTVPTTGYTIEGNTGTDAKEYTAKVTGKGNFKGTAQKKWTIGTADISNEDDFTASLDPTSFVYDGTEKKPTVTVTRKSDNAKLTLDTDYSVAYSNNINVGNNTAKATVTGKGNYKGTRVLTFSITNLAITSVTVDPSSLTYNGKEQTITIKEVKAGDKVLTTADYDIVSGNKGTNVGEYTLTVQGKGNYAGTASTKWNIVAASIKGATVTLNPTEYTYDGTAKNPTATVKVKLDGVEYTLEKDKDFTVSYSNNVNAGTATATITGKGNYKESTTKNFTIKPAELQTVTLENDKLTYIYNTEQTVEITSVTTKNGLTVAAANYTVSGNKGTDAKSYTLTVTAKANTNYTGSATVDWEIQKKSAKDFTVELDQREFTYDGNYKFPNVTVKDGSNVLAENTDYTLEFRDNKRAGINTAKVIVTGINNYTDKKEDVTFSILRADGEVKADPEQITMTYGLDPQTATVKIVSPTDLENYYFVSSDENVATVDPETGVVTSQGAGVATIYVVVMADNNYESMYAVCQVIVKPVEIVEADVTEGEANANGLPSYTVKKFGKTLEEGVDYTLEFFDKDEVKQAATYVVANPGDYMAVLTFSGNYYGIVEKKFKANGLPISVANFTNLLLNAENPNEPVNAENAKYNFNGDEFINIADLQALMNLQLGLTVEGDPISSGSRASVNVAEDAVMNISTSDLGGGVTRYALSLEGDREFTVFMMDITANGAMQVVGQQAAAADMTLHTGMLQNGTLRLLGIGAEQSGSVVYIDVMGEGSLNIENICFSTQSASAFYARLAGNATGIDQISVATAGGEFFGIGGQRQNELKKGVNIVRQNGKSVKVIRK